MLAATRKHFDSLQQEAFLNLWRTYDRLKIREDELFARYRLSAQQYNTLRLLRAEPQGLPTLTLGDRLISRAPDMTRLLDKLEQQKLIERQRRSDNRRVVDVRITPAGRKLLNQLDRQVRQMHQQQFGHLRAAELKQLIALLKRARAPHEDDTCAWLD